MQMPKYLREAKEQNRPIFTKDDFPKELKKSGISPKSFDAEMLSLYKKMKAEGASEYAKEQVEKLLNSNENDLDLLSAIEKKPTKVNKDYRSLFPGKQKVQNFKEEELPENIQKNMAARMKQYKELENLYKKKDLEKLKKKQFKDLVKKDVEATKESIENKEFGWLDKLKIEDPKSEKFKNMVNDWEEIQKDYFIKKEEIDDRRLYKETQKLEKIKQKRRVRDEYRDFKISAETEKPNDNHLQRSKKYLTGILQDMLNDNKQTVISGILGGTYLNIHDIIVTKSLSVIHIFFTLSFLDFKERPFDAVKSFHEEVRRKLIHSSPFLRSRVTQLAGLKYAPDLRFYAYDPAGSPKQALAGLENVEDKDNESDDHNAEEPVTVKLPGKYMKRKYYEEIGKERNSNNKKT